MIMTKEEKIEFIDDFLARCEDWMHGKDGEDVSVCRKYFSELEQQLGKTEQLSDGWISVDDDLPEHQQIVLVCHITGIEIYQFLDGNFYHYERGYIQKGLATHWMPLPNQPKQR